MNHHSHHCSCGAEHSHHHPECSCHEHTCSHTQAPKCSCNSFTEENGDDGGGDSDNCSDSHGGCCCGHNHTEQRNLKLHLLRFICGILILAVGMAVDFLPLIIIAYLIFGYDVIFSSFKNIRHGKIFDENFLMTIATIGAFIIGEYFEGCAVMLFYQVGEILGDIAVSRSKKSISKLMDIRPDTATVERNGEFITVSPEELEVGETVIVKAGERIPVDGTVIQSDAYIDSSALTGESMPICASVGTAVKSGCINTNGSLYIRTDKKYNDSTAARILHLVENTHKSKSERFITKFARVYTPIVVFLALTIAIIPPIITDTAFAMWIYRALIFLVISCPCALVVSIPLTFFAGIGNASKNGILIKGSDVMEKLANINTMLFDKTGTLTCGQFGIIEINGSDDVLKTAAYAEYYSNHPVSSVIKAEYKKSIDASKILNYSELAGLGVYAVIDDKEVLCGNSKLMEKYNITYDNYETDTTVIHVAKNGKYIGNILIADTLKDNSAKTISTLNKLGINTIMLTGDNKSTADRVASQLGINKVYSQLLPDDKLKICRELCSEGNVAFVGDGINDAPVLTGADVGFAMGGIGSDAAIEAADAVIMNDDPFKIVDALRISRLTNIIAKQNIVFSIAVKMCVMIFGTFGIATMWTAVFADVGVMLLAVLNALRAMKK